MIVFQCSLYKLLSTLFFSPVAFLSKLFIFSTIPFFYTLVLLIAQGTLLSFKQVKIC